MLISLDHFLWLLTISFSWRSCIHLIWLCFFSSVGCGRSGGSWRGGAISGCRGERSRACRDVLQPSNTTLLWLHTSCLQDSLRQLVYIKESMFKKPNSYLCLIYLNIIWRCQHVVHLTKKMPFSTSIFIQEQIYDHKTNGSKECVLPKFTSRKTLMRVQSTKNWILNKYISSDFCMAVVIVDHFTKLTYWYW